MNPIKELDHPGARFERIVASVFESNGFKVEIQSERKATSDTPLRTADLVLVWQGDVKTAVEVKFFRTRSPNPKDLERAASAALSAQIALRADHAMVVTNLRKDLLPNAPEWARKVVFIGIDDLASLSKDNVYVLSGIAEIDRELSSSLRDFDRESDIFSEKPPVDIANFKTEGAAAQPASPPTPSKGQILISDLRAIPAGKSRSVTLPSGRSGVPWRLFEDVCLDSLEYVFEGMLNGWKKQEAVSGDANRFDVLAKIVGNDVFCRTLVEDFRSRYILFEFKNYEKKILPNLIHITEKYLFPTALRATAIIISPQGLAPQSVQATHGALREVGKLIMDINTEMLISFLEDKDKGTTPSAKMEDHLDQFLQHVGR